MTRARLNASVGHGFRHQDSYSATFTQIRPLKVFKVAKSTVFAFKSSLKVAVIEGQQLQTRLPPSNSDCCALTKVAFATSLAWRFLGLFQTDFRACYILEAKCSQCSDCYLEIFSQILIFQGVWNLFMQGLGPAAHIDRTKPWVVHASMNLRWLENPRSLFSEAQQSCPETG